MLQEQISQTGPGTATFVPLSIAITPFQVTLQTVVTGTANYTVNYTKDDVYAAGYNPATGNWLPITGMTAATANAEATLISPVTAVQLVQNSGSGTTLLQVLQAGRSEFLQ